MMLWLYLHFPNLQLDTCYRSYDESDNDQQLKRNDAPLIIVHEKQNQVVQLNRLALQAGIQVGMGLGTAASLCHNLQVKIYQPELEEKILVRITHWLYPLTADIALYPPNGLLLRVSNMLTLYDNLAHYWQVLSQHLNHLAITYQYATGYSPYSARILSKQKLNQISNDNDWLFQQIKKQSLLSSDLAAKDITRLQKVGVHTFADLLVLSLPELSKRFTKDVVNYIGRLTGHIQHHVKFYIPPENFEQYLELYYEVSDHQYLEKPLCRLYRLLERYLQLKDKLAVELTILLHQRDADDLPLSVVAAQGEYKTDKWWQLTQLRLESVTLVAPVIAITLKVKRLSNKYLQHSDLFQGNTGNISKVELVSMLAAKLGEDKVKGLTLTADDRPEIANQLCSPFTEQNNNLCGDIDKLVLRPTILLPAPVPLTEKVSLLPFPERIVAGWWDEHAVIRDYFVARDPQGRWLWLFRDKNRHWFVHGVFS